jgi:hypothetical protein
MSDPSRGEKLRKVTCFPTRTVFACTSPQVACSGIRRTHSRSAHFRSIPRPNTRQTFLHIVSARRAIARILISEAANDVVDDTYDDFVCVR